MSKSAVGMPITHGLSFFVFAFERNPITWQLVWLSRELAVGSRPFLFIFPAAPGLDLF